jgi:hypothetical protein
MRKIIPLLSFIILTEFSFGQNVEYSLLIKKADSLYSKKDFKNSALVFSNAFKANGWIGSPADRYNAAYSWALANNADSAFFQLNRIATKANYSNYAHIASDPDLNVLHSDIRWITLLKTIKENKEKAESNLNKPLVAELDSIYIDDQKGRLETSEIEKKFGWKSKEMLDHWKVILEKDKTNLIKVKAIIDKYGWLGPDVIGTQGNSTLFLVIQHADQTTQEKYLPIMREAVKNGKAEGNSLALLEDRVALGQGKKQVYGSQIGQDVATQKYYVLPLEDPDNVDKRRAEVGLQPIATYVAYWQIIWNAEQYKKDLPLIQAKQNVKSK